MYNDWLSIGPFKVRGYGACMAIGLIAAFIVLCRRAKKRGLSEDMCYGILFCGAIFGWLGAKLMYVIVEWRTFLVDPKEVLSSAGFVVFGGITGGFLSVLIYCTIKKVSVLTYLDLAIPEVAIAQGFGRIGCFMAGCCYGKKTDAWFGITFTHSDYAPNGVKLIPTQLISSGLDFLNAIVLIIISGRAKKKGVVCACYLIFYSVGRFLVEMLRNDERGEVGKLSTSQFYGIFCLIIGIVFLIIVSKRKEKADTEAVNEAV